jgi:hypothetical protein
MDLIDHESDTFLEADLKKILFACILLFLILGCSSSNPLLSDVSVSNDNAVTGQRIFAQVISLTDNPPMTYQWTTKGGVLDVPETTPYSTYWIAPETPGSYAITCVVTDKDKKHLTHTFNVRVRARTLESNLVGAGLTVITLTKETEYKTGGIWASVRDNKIRFITSTSNTESVWGKNFFTMLNRTDPTTLVFTIWGVETSGYNIIELTASSSSTLAYSTCSTCSPLDTIKALAIDVNDLTTLWVGSDSTLNYYNPTSVTWNNYLFAKVRDLSEGPDYVYAATSTGVYKLDYGKKEPIYGGDTCAVLAVSNGSATEIWSVVQGAIQKDGKQLSTQPPEVICSLDKDITGNIWCGKYWWDGSLWHVVPDLESVTIVKSVASMEGLTYLLSDSGVLYRW